MIIFALLVDYLAGPFDFFGTQAGLLVATPFASRSRSGHAGMPSFSRSFGSLLGWFVRLQRPRWHPSSHSFDLMLGCFFGSSAFSHSFGPIDQLVSAGHVGMLASALFAFSRRLAPLSYLGTWACSHHIPLAAVFHGRAGLLDMGLARWHVYHHSFQRFVLLRSPFSRP